MIYLVHHGDALPAHAEPTRPLSPDGHRVTERLAVRAAALGAKPAAVYHSGKLRARETAQIYWTACNPFAAFKAMKGLQPDDDPSLAVSLIDTEGRTDDLMLVGHFPHLPRLLAALLLSPTQAGATPTFPQHGVVALEPADDGRWREVWRLTVDEAAAH